MKLTELPSTAVVEGDPKCGARRLYDYDAWFHGPRGDDGKVRFMLVSSEHYRCSQDSMMLQVRIAASHAGLRASVVDLVDRISVCVLPKVDYVELVSESPTVVVPFVRMTNVDRS